MDTRIMISQYFEPSKAKSSSSHHKISGLLLPSLATAVRASLLSTKSNLSSSISDSRHSIASSGSGSLSQFDISLMDFLKLKLAVLASRFPLIIWGETAAEMRCKKLVDESVFQIQKGLSESEFELAVKEKRLPERTHYGSLMERLIHDVDIGQFLKNITCETLGDKEVVSELLEKLNRWLQNLSMSTAGCDEYHDHAEALMDRRIFVTIDAVYIHAIAIESIKLLQQSYPFVYSDLRGKNYPSMLNRVASYQPRSSSLSQSSSLFSVTQKNQECVADTKKTYDRMRGYY